MRLEELEEKLRYLEEIIRRKLPPKLIVEELHDEIVELRRGVERARIMGEDRVH